MDDEKVCVANECIFTRWTKPTEVRGLKFVSKDVIFIHIGKTIIFYNIRTNKDFLVLSGKESTPANGNCLPLDGIGCVDSCETDLLAIAEQFPSAKVIICRHSDLKVLASLIDDSCSAAYKSISFLRLDYLVGLRNYPAHDFIFWAWRTQEKLITVKTGFIQPNQYLSVSATRRNGYLSLMERDVICKLKLWTVLISCKRIYAEKTIVELSDEADFDSGCWMPSGWFVFCDVSGKVYRTQPRKPSPKLCFEYTTNNEKLRTLMCPTKEGFMFYSVDDLSCFKDFKGVFTKMWSIEINKHTLITMVAGENNVYGWSDEGTLLELTPKKEQVLKVYGTNIKHFVFIKPTDETVATVNGKNVLQVWDVFTGLLKNEMALNGFATHLCSNPLYCYVAVSFKDGKVELLKTDTKENNLEHITKMILCDDEISSLNFCSNGEECWVISYPTGRFYFISIKVGKTYSVRREFHLKKQVIDVEVIDNKTSSYLSVLYKNDETTHVAGNNIVLFDVNFNIVVQVIDSKYCYTSIFKWSSFGEQNVISIACVVLSTRCIYTMIVNVDQANISESKMLRLNHELRNVQVFAGKHHCISFSADGKYNLYEFDDNGHWKTTVTVNCSHWQTGGLVAGMIDTTARNILTLSRRGNFMCTSFNKNCYHTRRYHQVEAPKIIENIKTEGIVIENETGTTERMTLNEFNAYSQQRNQVMQRFGKIKTELLKLLEKNMNGPEDQRLSIEEFDLNVEHRMLFRKKSKNERLGYEAKIVNDIKKMNMETNAIIEEHWESSFVKPKSIHCLEKSYKVNNYLISIKKQEVTKKANQIIKKRNINKKHENSASSKNNLKMLNKSIFSELGEVSDNTLLTGSISYRFIDSIDHMNPQCGYYKLEMAVDEIILLEHTINRLKHSFNELFDDMFNEKQRQLNILKNYNKRLRDIETEFKWTLKIELVEPLPVDYEWSQYERTERLLYVDDHEVSKRTMINVNLAKEEQNMKILASKNFRQRALIDMMDGMLEKRWEDELRKEVLKPQCMLNKKSENYTKNDLNDISNYEKAVVVRNDQLMKYKKILEEEKTKIKQNIKEVVENLDSRVYELFKIKLKYDSAINQEHMKMIRLSKMLSESEQRKQQIQLHNETKSEIENAIIETNEKISETKVTITTLQNTINILEHQNIVLDKRFESKFSSRLEYKKCLNLFNRRPKIHGSTNDSLLLSYQFVNTIMKPNEDKLNILCSEFVQYLNTLEIFDNYKYVKDYKLNMDKETWHILCNFRRKKIESEFNISTCQRDKIDKTDLIVSLKRHNKHREGIIKVLKSSVATLENQESRYENNPEIQLMVKQGNTEIELTGHVDDFMNTMFIAKHRIEEVNIKTKKTGEMKIATLTNLLKAQRECRDLKLEHEILKNYKIKLYKNRFDVIQLMKVTHNMLSYARDKEKGINIIKQAEKKVNKELTWMETAHENKKRELELSFDKLMKKIEHLKKENGEADKKINEMTLNLSRLKSEIDPGLTDKLKLERDLRMKLITRRAQRVRNIKELQREIAQLEIELKLLQLKSGII